MTNQHRPLELGAYRAKASALRVPRHEQVGLYVFGDIHGHPDAMIAHMELAHELKLGLGSVMDWIDRGPNTPACMEIALGAEFRALVAANHEFKYLRYRNGYPEAVKPHGLGRTIEQTVGRILLSDEFCAFIRWVPLWHIETIGGRRIHIIHGAYHAEQRAPVPRLNQVYETKKHPKTGPISYALWGQEVDLPGEDKSVRLYDWVDTIPAGVDVVVGHNCMSTAKPLVWRNANGGQAHMIDCGIDKGGVGGAVAFFDDGSFRHFTV